jgi:hypothetical protein
VAIRVLNLSSSPRYIAKAAVIDAERRSHRKRTLGSRFHDRTIARAGTRRRLAYGRNGGRPEEAGRPEWRRRGRWKWDPLRRFAAFHVDDLPCASDLMNSGIRGESSIEGNENVPICVCVRFS